MSGPTPYYRKEYWVGPTRLNVVIAGSCICATCPDCGKFIRLNKPILGSLHVCIGEEERARRARRA